MARVFVVLSLVLVLGGGAWLALRGWTAASAAGRAEQALRSAGRSYADGDLVAGAAHVRSAGEELHRARRATGDPVWALASTLPVLGDDVDAVRTLLRGGAGVVEAAVPLAQLAADPALATTGTPGAARLLALARDPRVPAALGRTHEQALLARSDLDRAAAGSLHPAVAARVEQARDLLDGGTDALGGAVAAAALLPALVGPEGSPPLLVVVQTPAEVRTLGGLAGLVLVVGEREGGLQVLESYAGSSVPPADAPLLSSPELDAWYGLFGEQAGRFMVNATALPDARDASALLAEGHVRRGGQAPSGVVLTDLAVLSGLLRATGPVPLPDGRQLEAGTSDALLQHGVYVEQPDPAAQDAFFAAAARSVVDGLQGPDLDGAGLVREVAAQARAGRISVWSPEPDLQEHLEVLGVLGDRLADPGSVGVFLNDSTGAKMQYFLTTRVDVRDGPAGGSTVRVELVSSAPAGEAAEALPGYVVGGAERMGLPRGGQRVQLSVVGPLGDGPAAWRVDGVTVPAAATAVDGRGAGALGVDVAPGARVVVEVDLATSTGVTREDLVVTPGTEVCDPSCT